VTATANLVHTNQRLVEFVSKPKRLSGHQYVCPSSIRVVPGSSSACHDLNTLYGVEWVRKPQNITHFASALPEGPTLTEHASVSMGVTGEPARSRVRVDALAFPTRLRTVVETALTSLELLT